jgi:release factor glutamine methyltransferase
MGKQYSVIDVINIGKDYLSKHNIESPRLVAEILLSNLLGVSRLDLYTQYDKPIMQEEVDKLNEMMKRAAQNEPVQHIVGKIDFMDISLCVSSSALIPRPETEELVSMVAEKINANLQFQNILDIGTGSGCIALALADKCTGRNVFGIDIDKKALALAIQNRDDLNSTAKFKLLDILVEKPKMQFDYIISNPPYISYKEYQGLDENVKGFEPQDALTDGADGLTFYRSFAQLFKEILVPDGEFALEIGYNQRDAIMEIFREDYDISIEKDISGNDRFVFGKFKKITAHS